MVDVGLDNGIAGGRVRGVAGTARPHDLRLRAGLTADRSQFYKDLSAPFYGANRPGSTVSQGLRDWFWLMSMSVGVKGAYDCIKAFSETDLTEDLKKFDIPTLIIHGDDDQIVLSAPPHSSHRRSSRTRP